MLIKNKFVGDQDSSYFDNLRKYLDYTTDKVISNFSKELFVI